ncbi:hypothetical protein CROQUDRAFT_35763 [Cronartium quercuum f. sp. fusiforme G11]|uniref:Uncharacterized protein n=1 Tax=Cronartium quercuum f. sp. fusiforme G11 TaxID=708437 RepID=A0A9P6NRM4_9BASI|nr:hypothetical protein CROQUDRAFT_35763 [Cronartium quercuum f. sp. fusiforme G11]
MSVSLKESCLRILTAHSSGLIDVGNCSYGLIRPILFACPPDQLAEIEDRSPHLMLESDEIWALHLKRDYPSETASSPVKHTLSTSTSSECDLQEVDLPPNRLKYFDTRASKEQALASASARLRERTLANRSDTTKRKAIFTGETDRGLGSKRKKLGGSRPWGTPGGTGMQSVFLLSSM